MLSNVIVFVRMPVKHHSGDVQQHAQQLVPSDVGKVDVQHHVAIQFQNFVARFNLNQTRVIFRYRNVEVSLTFRQYSSEESRGRAGKERLKSCNQR